MARGLSPSKFALSLTAFGKVTREQATVIFQKIAIDLDARVVLSTPVDEGRARANWYPSLNAPSSERDDDARDKSGSGAAAAATSMAMGAKLGDTIWLTNNLPYILPLENGHSKQAKQGMVDINLNAVAEQYGGTISR
tara:strand:- start:519 stop:932 length:414 start_codon:yes stop_codon:yes gene_type:complete